MNKRITDKKTIENTNQIGAAILAIALGKSRVLSGQRPSNRGYGMSNGTSK